jgi:hypothetical protein
MRALSELLGKILLAALVLWIGSVALTPPSLRPQVICRPLSLTAEAAANLLGAAGYTAHGTPEGTINTNALARACIDFVTSANHAGGLSR